MKHLLAIKDLSKGELLYLVKEAAKIKKSPKKYANKMNGKTLLMIFEAPSLRTRLSFEIAMFQMGGHAIFYTTGESTLGKKESMKDFSRVESRYVDIVMARLFSHQDLNELAKYSEVPVINGMTNREHPCQIIGDLVTMYEKRKKIKKVAYVGDCNNNVTNSLLYATAKLGIDVAVASPGGREFEPDKAVLKECRHISRAKVEVFNDAKKAVKGSDFVYTDSWMSYRVPKAREPFRVKKLRAFQVNSTLMKHSGGLFMHCLPAKRGHEVTDDVMDSPASVVIDQAENRMHAEKAILLWLFE